MRVSVGGGGVGGVIEINGVRSEGAIRTMEGSKEGRDGSGLPGIP